MRKVFFLLVLLAAIAGCKESPPRTAPALNITLAYTTQPNCALVHIAMAKGYFEREGLAVRPLLHTYGKAALQSVLDGKADLATVAETPLVFAVLGGQKVSVIANIYHSNRNNAIIARKDRGIQVPGDLRGKRIGYTPGTTSDFFMDSLFTANGIERGEVVPVPLKPDEMYAALTGGSVDAVCTWNFPLILLRRQLGDNGVAFFDHQLYTETFNIAAWQTFAHNNPEALKRFLRALVEAERFARTHPDEAIGLVAAAVKIDKDLLRGIWTDFVFRVALDKTLLITMEDETRWALKKRLTEKTEMPDYRAVIHDAPLRAVSPEAVRIKR